LARVEKVSKARPAEMPATSFGVGPNATDVRYWHKADNPAAPAFARCVFKCSKIKQVVVP
jgi:hypothetical protein